MWQRGMQLLSMQLPDDNVNATLQGKSMEFEGNDGMIKRKVLLSKIKMRIRLVRILDTPGSASCHIVFNVNAFFWHSEVGTLLNTRLKARSH